MPGVPKELIEHSLNVNPTTTPKKQRLWMFSAEKREAIKKELAKLLTAGFIKEVYHPEWLANPILVLKKNNNEWRMCVDNIYLNKHCPKDPFGLPRIDQVIELTAGCVLLSFLDCYSGYHQIALKEEDQIKMAFITPFGAYAYKTISFGLKNTGATYQRAIQLCFTNQLYHNVKAYFDDVVVKTGIRLLYSRPRRNLQQFPKLQVEAEPDQVRFRLAIRQTTRLHRQSQRD